MLPRLSDICLLLLLANLQVSTAVAQEWSRFRGPNGSGRAVSDAALPTTWSNQEGILWKVSVPRGSSSPVISKGMIFVTGFSGYAMDMTDFGERASLNLHVLAYDLESGKNLWDYQMPASAEEQQATQRIADHGYASSTACTDGQGVYASFGPSGVVALDMTGKLLWHQDVGSGTAGFGAASSPIEFEDLVIVNASIESKTLYGLDKQTGAVRWKVEGVERAWTTPALVRLEDGSTELVIHFKDQVQGLEPRTGERLWFCSGIPDYIVPVPIVNGDTIYFSGGRQNRTIALKAGGRGDVTETHKLWEVTKGANVTTPVYHDGRLFWAHDKAFAQALDSSTGELLFQERFSNRDRVYSSVIFGDGKLYMTQREGTTLVLEPADEYREIAANKLGEEDEQFNATPALHEDTLIFRSTKFLYRVGR